jgi:hypothetical protein
LVSAVIVPFDGCGAGLRSFPSARRRNAREQAARRGLIDLALADKGWAMSSAPSLWSVVRWRSIASIWRGFAPRMAE